MLTIPFEEVRNSKLRSQSSALTPHTFIVMQGAAGAKFLGQAQLSQNIFVALLHHSKMEF